MERQAGRYAGNRDPWAEGGQAHGPGRRYHQRERRPAGAAPPICGGGMRNPPPPLQATRLLGRSHGASCPSHDAPRHTEPAHPPSHGHAPPSGSGFQPMGAMRTPPGANQANSPRRASVVPALHLADHAHTASAGTLHRLRCCPGDGARHGASTTSGQGDPDHGPAGHTAHALWQPTL